MGRGDADSDIELMPEVLAESVPAELLSRPSPPSACMGTGRTTPDPGELAALLMEVSATVLAASAACVTAAAVVVVSRVGAISWSGSDAAVGVAVKPVVAIVCAAPGKAASWVVGYTAGTVCRI